MLPKEIIKKIRLIDIKTRLLVNELFSGEYHSVFKGRGIEFSEVREYTYGDDIRTIDWNVTARFNKPFVKVYEEERELSVIILFDLSSSTLFGSSDNTKRDIMIELSALLTFSAIENNDKSGVVFFSDGIEKYISPQKDKTHALRILRELLYIKPKGKRTSIKTVCDFINKIPIRRSIVFIFSDFFDKDYEKSFKMMAKRHDVIPVIFNDPLEMNIINHSGIIFMKDIETGIPMPIDTHDLENINTYKRNLKENIIRRKQLFNSLGIDCIEVYTDRSYLKPLIEFFNKRSKRL